MNDNQQNDHSAQKQAALKLRPRVRRFIELYLGECNFNGTQAALKAGYSPKSAPQTAWEILNNPKVVAYMRELSALDGVNEFRTIRELADVGYSDWREHLEIETDREGNVRAMLVLKDKVKALEILAKIQGLTIDRHEVTGKEGGPVETMLILPTLDAE